MVTMSENRGMLKTLYQQKEYPDPRTLPPQPSWQQPRPPLTLSDFDSETIHLHNGQDRISKND